MAAGNRLPHYRGRIARVQNGFLRPCPQAVVTVYQTNSNGSYPIDEDGNTIGTPVAPLIYSDELGTQFKFNPITTDAEGRFDFYVDKNSVHLLVATVDGQTWGELDVDVASAYSDEFEISTGTSDPASPRIGRAFFNTSTNKLRIWNGSAWKEIQLV